MSASAVMAGISMGLDLVKSIIEMVKNGATDKEIRERIAAPGGVAQNLIDQLRSNDEKIDDFIDKG